MKSNILKLITSAFLGLLLMLFGKSVVFAQTPSASLALPATLSTTVGQQIDVPVSLNTGGAGVRGVDIILNFDRTKLSVVSIIPNTSAITLKTITPVDVNGNFNSTSLINSANSNGKLEFGLQTFDWKNSLITTPYTGNVQIATIRFNTLSIGTTPITFSFTPGSNTDSNVVLSANPPQDILSQVTNLNLTVIAVPTSTPTPTPISTPTLTPTPTPTSSPTPSDIDPPTAPSNLTITLITSAQVKLSWSPSTDNVGVAKYWIIRDGQTIGSTSSATTTYADSTVLPLTTYGYYILATDDAGNFSQPSFTISATTLSVSDTSSPTIPTYLTAKVVSSSQINLSWKASTDNVGVAGYRVYRNGVQISTVNTTSFGDSGLTPYTKYSYFIEAYDTTGNLSQQSKTISATTQKLTSVGSISGVVSSFITGQPIYRAKVVLYTPRIKTYYTNLKGIYTITNLPPGIYSLNYSAKTYLPQTIDINILASYRTTRDVILNQ